jgi:hypothetical protein
MSILKQGKSIKDGSDASKVAEEKEPKEKENNRELSEMIDKYKQAKGNDEETAVELRHDILQKLKDNPHLLEERDNVTFLAHEIEADEIAELNWDSPAHMVEFSDSLYQTRFKNDEFAQQLRQHATILLRRAIYHFEEEEENLEKMFRLMRLVPTYLVDQSEELSRLRYRANAYEIRRVRRSRRLLYGYLICQIVLVLIIFPYLFINAENGRLQNQVEQLADVELGDEGYQLITYSEGVYWAVITAASIGYGDITPTTTTGRIIAGTLGTMGVITVGILAGLVLDWITPRQIT